MFEAKVAQECTFGAKDQRTAWSLYVKRPSKGIALLSGSNLLARPFQRPASTEHAVLLNLKLDIVGDNYSLLDKRVQSQRCRMTFALKAKSP